MPRKRMYVIELKTIYGKESGFRGNEE